MIVVYYLFGYRKIDLLKAALLIVFIAAMVWLYFDYRDLDILISSVMARALLLSYFW